jgi:hypothetical protein
MLMLEIGCPAGVPDCTEGMPTMCTCAEITADCTSFVLFQWSTGKFPNPAPTSVKIFWSLFISALVAYPVFHFGLYKRDRRQSGRNTPVTFEDGQKPNGKTKGLKQT